MNDSELDALLAQPLPERDAGEFSVTLMERIARHQSRGARLLAWISIGVLTWVVAAATIYGAKIASHASLGGNPFLVPAALLFLALLLSYAVTQSARE